MAVMETVLLVSAFFTVAVKCDIQFQSDTEQCLNQLVEYQCTVTGEPILTWRVLRDDDTMFGSAVAYTITSIQDPDIIGGLFTVEQIARSPSIVSNVSFTVQSSINGYTIQCEDLSLDIVNRTINITDPPPPPSEFDISFTAYEARISWTQPVFLTRCYEIAGYTVNLSDSSNITSTVLTLNTDTTGVSIPLAGLTNNTYYVSVASLDTANRTGTFSTDSLSFTLSEPESPVLTYMSFDGNTDSSALIQLNWNFNNLIPPLRNVYVSENVTGSLTVIPGTVARKNLEIERGQLYLFTVFGENILANGSVSEILIFVDRNAVLPTLSTSVIITNTGIALTTTGSTGTPLPPEREASNGPSITVIVVVVVLVVVTVVAGSVFLSIILFIIIKKSKKKGKTSPDQDKGSETDIINSSSTEALKSSIVLKHENNDKIHYATPIIPSKRGNLTTVNGTTKKMVEYADVFHNGVPGKIPSTSSPVNYSTIAHNSLKTINSS